MTEPKKFVLGFMFDEDRETVLLLRKTKPASIAGKLNGVGGKVEPGETFADAMVREFAEEVGIDTTKADWEHCLYFTGKDSSFGQFAISVYRTFGDPWRFRRMEEERPSVWFMDALPTQTIVENLKWMLPMLADRRVVFPLAIEQS